MVNEVNGRLTSRFRKWMSTIDRGDCFRRDIVAYRSLASKRRRLVNYWSPRLSAFPGHGQRIIRGVRSIKNA